MVAPINDFMNLAPKVLNWERTTILISLLGILMQPWKFLADPKAYVWTWLLGYGAFTGGIAGVVIADYWIIRKQSLKLLDLYKRDGFYNFSGGSVSGVAVGYGVILVIAMIVLYATGAILGTPSSWPSVLTMLILVLGLIIGIIFYVSKIKCVNFCGVLSLFTGIGGSLLLSKLSAALAQWTWFVGAFVALIAYLVLYNAWYGKHHPAIAE